MAAILWRRSDGAALERCVLEPTPEGHRIAGTVLGISADGPHEIRYSVLTDPEWRTKTVGAHVQGPGGDRRLALRSDGAGAWASGDAPLIELYGTLDVHLTWTPSTFTPVIMRLALDVGQSADVAMAVIDYPSHEIRRTAVTYARTSAGGYTVGDGATTVALTVGEHGLVTAQADMWETVDAG